MKTSILTTDFNFAKSINLSLIAAPDAYPSYPSGMLDFIKPYLQELQEVHNHSRLLNSSINPNYR